MQITDTMDLNQLPEVLEKHLSHLQTDSLRKRLNETRYQTLDEVPQGVWLSLMERVRFDHPTR